MAKLNPAFDAYIAKAPEYARPILTKIRRLVHQACPEIEEELKWSHPSFVYRGIVAGMAAFKNYVTFGFWKHQLIRESTGTFTAPAIGGTNTVRLTRVSDLPADEVILDCIRQVVALNEQGVKVPKAKKPARSKEVEVPNYFRAALKKNKKALATFESLSPSHQREYVEWLTEAKQEATRQKRLTTALEWLAEGKSRNWKYEQKK